MKQISLFLCWLCFCMAGIYAFGQTAKSPFATAMALREDSMKKYAFDIVNAREAAERFRADSNFTRLLVRALKEPKSFYYPFDSLQAVSRLYAPDSSFRIFTWQVIKDERTFRRHGAIQINTPDGSLKLYPLLDKTAITEDVNNAVTDNDHWIGAIYYRIIQKEYKGKKIYTLLGYDENNFRSTKKWIDVLTFDASGKPVFGGTFFSFKNDAPQKPVQSRFNIEYKKGGNGSMRYDEELGIIIFDHLIPENNEPAKKYTFIPDGDYEGFAWENGKWVHIDKVFNFKLQEGQAPVEKPVLENKLGIKNLQDPGKPKKTKSK